MNPYLISKVEALLEESKGIGVEKFIVWTKFQDLTLHDAHIVIKLNIRSMNVYLLKIMWGKDVLNISRIWIWNLKKQITMDMLSQRIYTMKGSKL